MSLTPTGAVATTESRGGPQLPTHPPQFLVPLAAMAFGADSIAVDSSPEDACLNLSADLADALTQDHPELLSPIPNSQEIRTPASLPKHMRRARSSSRTPLLGQFVSLHDPDKDALMRSNSVQVQSGVAQIPDKRGVTEVKGQSRARSSGKSIGNSKPRQQSIKSYKSRTVMRGDRVASNSLDAESAHALNLQQEILLQQRQQLLQEQAKNQLLVDQRNQVLQQNRLIAADAHQAGLQRDNLVNVCVQAETLMENQRLDMAKSEAQVVVEFQTLQSKVVASDRAQEVLENQKQQLQMHNMQVAQSLEIERAANQKDVESLKALFEQQKQELVAVAESSHALRKQEWQQLMSDNTCQMQITFDKQLSERVAEIQNAARIEFEAIQSKATEELKQAKNQYSMVKSEHAKQSELLQTQSGTIARLETQAIALETRIKSLSQVEKSDTDEIVRTVKSDHEEEIRVLEDEQKSTRLELKQAKLENAAMSSQMDILNQELLEKKAAAPKPRALSVGAKRPSVQIGGAQVQTFVISTPRENHHETPGKSQGPGGDEDAAETEFGTPDQDYDDYENDDADYGEGYEDEEETQDENDTNQYTEEEWASWRAWQAERKDWKASSNVTDIVALAIKDKEKSDKEKESECLVTSLEFQGWPSHGQAKGWRFNTKEKWAKGTKDQNGMLQFLTQVEIADSWEELKDPDKFAKINRLAFDALWKILPPRLLSELTALKGKLMCPTEVGMKPQFMNAPQVYWFIMREFKRPGGLIGQTSYRDLILIKFQKCDSLSDFQRQWDECLANFEERPSKTEFRRMDCGDIYKSEVCKDSAFKNHLTIYRTGIDASLIQADYDTLHDIVDTYIATQDVERRRNSAEKAMEKKTAAAYSNSSNYAFAALATDSKKPCQGECREFFYTGDCQKRRTQAGCSYTHTNALPPNERRKGKGKGNGKGKKGKGKGKKGDGKGKKGKGKGKGNGKGKQPREQSRGRPEGNQKNSNGQPTTGRSPSGEPAARLCRFVKSGKCTTGDNCPYWHPGICRQFQKGTCALGAKCVFMHPKGSALPAVGTAKPKAKADPVAKAQAKATAAAKRASQAQADAAKAQKAADAAANPQGDQ